MDKEISRFLGTTALVAFPARTLTTMRDPQRRPNGVGFINCVASNCRSGIMKVIRHRAPQLTDDMIRQAEIEQPEYITRHIEERFLSSALRGYFQFGSLVNYRAQEGNISGRLGDHQESRIQHIFNSRTGFVERANLEGLEIIDASFPGTGKHIIVETIANDYCSCSSIGEFSLERGRELRAHETDASRKPGAFVTYHLSTLKLALEECVSRSENLSGLALFGCRVGYGEKDRSWEIERGLTYQRDRDAMAIWLSIAFVKSPAFEHEQEYRLLLLDPSSPGGLADDTRNYVINESSAIAASVVASGTY